MVTRHLMSIRRAINIHFSVCEWARNHIIRILFLDGRLESDIRFFIFYVLPTFETYSIFSLWLMSHHSRYDKCGKYSRVNETLSAPRQYILVLNLRWTFPQFRQEHDVCPFRLSRFNVTNWWRELLIVIAAVLGSVLSFSRTCSGEEPQNVSWAENFFQMFCSCFYILSTPVHEYQKNIKVISCSSLIFMSMFQDTSFYFEERRLGNFDTDTTYWSQKGERKMFWQHMY